MNQDAKFSLSPVMQDSCRVTVRELVSREYHLRLWREITDPDDFHDELSALAEATENDIVIIHAVTPGGQLVSCDLLCNAIRSCPALTIARIGIECASAGSAIALACDEWEVSPSSTMMIHELQYQPPGGAVSSVRASHEHVAQVNERFVRQTYTGFLSEEEIQQVLDNKELYFYAEDLMERLPKYAAYRNAEMERIIAEAEDSEG